MSDPRTPRPDDADPGETRSVETGPGPATPARDLTGGREWGDLRLTNEIGHGGFGRVYRAWDETLAREVAVKIIKPKDAAHRAEVLREGKMLARVKHPNVVTVFRAQQVGDEVGITMELIHGRHLSDVVAQSGRMGADEAAVIGITLCQALGAVHGAALLHRDVKARNVMREDGGRIVLMDFGAGRESVPVASRRSISDLSGTPLYLAPELFAGRTASPASDLYSLGVLLFFLVTRKYPVEGTSLSDLVLKHAGGERRLLSDVRPDLPPAFVQVVQRALSPKPEQRQRSAGALMADLSEAMPDVLRHRDSAMQAPLQVPPLEPTTDDKRKSWSTTRAVTVFLAIVVALGVLGFLTTAHYDRAIGRDPSFSGEGPGTWLELGGRSVVFLVAMTIGVLLISRLAGAIWFFTRRAAPPVGRVADLARTSISGRFLRLAPDAPAAAQALLVIQVLAIGLWAWAFWPLLRTLPMTVNTVDARDLKVLNPVESNTVLYLYRTVATPMLALMAVGWYWLLVRSPTRAGVPRATGAAGISLMLLVLLLLEVPERLFYRSAALRYEFEGQRCYHLGKTATETLLYCPDLPKQPFTRIVKSDQIKSITPTGPEGIFTLPGPPASK